MAATLRFQAFALPVLQVVHESLRAKRRMAAIAGTSSSTGASSSGQRSSAPSGVELSQEDRDGLLSIQDGTRCQARHERSWGGGRATVGAFGGKVYYEVSWGGAGE